MAGPPVSLKSTTQILTFILDLISHHPYVATFNIRLVQRATLEAAVMFTPTALKEVEGPLLQGHGRRSNEGEHVGFLLDPQDAVAADAEVFVTPLAEETNIMSIDEEGRPRFAPSKDMNFCSTAETRKIPIPPHRMTPLKQAWSSIYPPIVEHLKLQCRMNLKRKIVELRTSRHTIDSGALQKGEDFIKAFTLGFDVDDAIALLRLDDLYIETFEIKDVKTAHGDSQSRAIGRIAGYQGKTKFAIENASRTRIVLADSKIHILGGFKNINMARESVVSLILGKPPSKVYGNLRTVAARMKERF